MRLWTAGGDGRHWADPDNWSPRGAPQPGDDLRFTKGNILDTTPTEMINDLGDATLGTIHFDPAATLTGTDWVVDGGLITITKSIYADGFFDQRIHLNCPLRLGGDVSFRAIGDPDVEMKFFLKGALDLNGHKLELYRENIGAFDVASEITGQGQLYVVNGDIDTTLVAVFGGARANTFSGALSVLALPNARPCRVSFDKAGGVVAPNGLNIAEGCTVSLQRPEQIGDDAVVSIKGGGRLLLNRHAETIGSLVLTTLHADADPTLVETDFATLTLRGDLTTSVFNENGVMPTIRGTLALSEGPHLFHLNNPLGGEGLDLSVRLSGPGSLIKDGNAKLVLRTFNAFGGAVSVREGVVEIQSPQALGATTGGLVLEGGTVTLRDTQIAGETLFVRGTRSITANTVGSLLTCIGTGAWLGPIQLETNLVVNSTGLLRLKGPITGPGGLEFLGARHEFGRNDSAQQPFTYTGTTRVLCELLTVFEERPFFGPLIIGGGFSPRCEIRWENSFNHLLQNVTLHSNAVATLNGRDATWVNVTLRGGHVSTGSGQLKVIRVKVDPTETPAVIDGQVRLDGFPATTFTVEDGPAMPDLSINAAISEAVAGTRLEKLGDGQLDFHRANTYSGETLVSAGTLGVLNNSALGATTQGTWVENGATVAFGIQAEQLLEPFTIAGSGVGGIRGALVSGADVWINADIALSGSAAIRADGTNSRVQVNNLSGVGDLTKLGSGRLVLRGEARNSYRGATIVQQGVLDLAKPTGVLSVPSHLIIGGGSLNTTARVEHRSSFAIGGSVTIHRGGLWDLNGATETFDVAALEGRPPLTFNGGGSVQTGAGILVLPVGGDVVAHPSLLGSPLIVGRLGLDPGPHRFMVSKSPNLLGLPDATVSAVISQTSTQAGLEKSGAGTLVLSGANTYAGDTTVLDGRLQVEGSQAQSLVRINAGTLLGAGIVGPVVISSSLATVAPRSTPSILTCGNLSAGAAGSGTLQVQLNGSQPGTGYDQVRVRGTVDLSRIKLSASLGFASGTGDQFMIIENDGADPVAGAFVGLAEDASLFITGEPFRISYQGGDGNDVVLMHQSALDVSASVWTNTLGGDWNSAFNWSNQQVPDGSSAAVTNNGIYVITNHVNLSIDSFYFANGFCTLAGSGNLDLAGPFIWEAGSLRGAGTITARGGMKIGGAANLTGKVVEGKALVNSGAATWTGDGTISFHDGALLSNTATGTFDCIGDGQMDSGTGTHQISNTGLFRKMGGTRSTRLFVPFHNSGTVEVQTGTLSLNSGGTNLSTVSVSGGATLELGGSPTFTAASVLTGAGNLTVNGFAGTNIQLAGSVDLSGDHTFNAGTVRVTGDYRCVNNRLTIADSAVHLNGTGKIVPAELNLGRFGLLTGSNDVTVSGPMTWGGSSVLCGSGTVQANGGLLISGSAVLDGKMLVNNAAARWTNLGAGSLTLSGGAIISNAVGATFECSGPGALAGSGTRAGLFLNHGAFRRGGDTNEVRMGALFDNRGTVEIDSGSLLFSGGSTNLGEMRVAAGAQLNLGGGTYDLPPESSLTGEGDFLVSGATANLAGLVHLRGTHTYTAGTANITGEYHCASNAVNILGGTANFNGTGILAPAALTVGPFGKIGGSNTISVSGPLVLDAGSTLSGTNEVFAHGQLALLGSVQIIGRTLVNQGTGFWTNRANGMLTLGGGAVISNAPGAVFDVASDGDIVAQTDTSAILNAGLLRKIGGAATASLNVQFTNTGTVEIQAGTLSFSRGFAQEEGVTQLNGGNLSSVAPLQIRGGRLGGRGLISGDVSNGGIISPGNSPGQLVIAGNYTQTATGTLAVEIGGTGPGAGFDQLVVSNEVVLDGRLEVTFTQGFSPPANSSFQFLTASKRSGRFATLTYPSNEVGLAVSGAGEHLALQVVNTRPRISPLADQVGTNFSLLRVAVDATDDDVPAQALAFSLTDSPTGAEIDDRGVVSWRPVVARTPTTVRFTVTVTDNGTPQLTSSQTFAVLVLEAGPSPLVSRQPGPQGDRLLTLTFFRTPGSEWLTQYATNLPGRWLDLATSIADIRGECSLVDPNATNAARFYRVLPRFGP
ncbi:MAG: autotransporter-associated beta strand repeat-containing protein [Verrucomicrobiales bacterium]|nr:autotransporter-associated beta strand repeat-containing protein [Verrucomicrobiales bacterium]